MPKSLKQNYKNDVNSIDYNSIIGLINISFTFLYCERIKESNLDHEEIKRSLNHSSNDKISNIYLLQE